MNEKSSVLPSIRPASELRTKFTDVMDEIHQSNHPVFLTSKGRCDTVIMSADTFSKYEMNREARINAYLSENDGTPIRCSFCGKLHESVYKIIAGKDVYICNECVDVCNEVLKADIPEGQ